MNGDKKYFERLSSLRTEVLFIGLSLLFFVFFYTRSRVTGWDGWSITFFCLFLMFLFYLINYRVLIIKIENDLLKLNFGLFTWKIALENIERTFVDPTSLWRIGGAGIHFTLLGGRYRAMFNFLEYPRVVIALNRKKGPVQDIAFSTRHPDEVMALLQRPKKHRQ